MRAWHLKKVRNPEFGGDSPERKFKKSELVCESPQRKLRNPYLVRDVFEEKVKSYKFVREHVRDWRHVNLRVLDSREIPNLCVIHPKTSTKDPNWGVISVRKKTRNLHAMHPQKNSEFPNVDVMRPR